MQAVAPSATDAILRIDDLRVSLRAPGGRTYAVNGASLSLRRGRVLALVGESGSGKSITARAVLRLLPAGATVQGRVLLDGRDLLRLSGRELRRVRGRRVALAFQNAAASLNPVQTIGSHLRETFRAHLGRGPRPWQQMAVDALRNAGIDDGLSLLDAYPFELSGGQQQRAALALATALNPGVLIADEVTTALDVTTQAIVLDQLRAFAHERGQAVLLITHDLAVAAHWADDLAVMYGGTVVEEGLLLAPRHPYTAALVASQPRLAGGQLRAIEGRAETLLRPPAHCPFAPRCPRTDVVCVTAEPPPLAGEGGAYAACYHPLERVR
jgi:oligopeptide/dipeptide ABC transporter ATP-binding protein